MINLVICGAGGRMGQTLQALAGKSKEFSVMGLLEAKGHPLVGQDVHGIRVGTDLKKVLSSCEVVIDFTVPESTLKNASLVAESKKAYVVGTTGWSGNKRKVFVRLVSSIPVVFSPNMSLGANLLFEYSEALARVLPEYDVEITEVHHNLKKDSPSGTAQRLAEGVAKGHGRADQYVYGRHGILGSRKTGEIGIHSLRGGDAVGDHTVFFIGQGERIELTHRATSRDAFANGALTAAKWLVGREPGLYDMRDVLKDRTGDLVKAELKNAKQVQNFL